MSNVFQRLACGFGFLISVGTAACVKHPEVDLEAIDGAAEASQPPALPPSTQSMLLAQSEAAWRAARASHPLHFQGVFAGARSDGQTTVIVTEPPPHTQASEVQKILHATAIGVRPWRIGVDGELRDLVAVVPEMAPALQRERLAALHQYLFSSTYRAKVYDPFEKPTANQPLDIDLTVPLGALYEWVQSPKARFSSLDGAEVTAQRLATQPQSGVFRLQDVGVSLWFIPRGLDLCAARAQAREFALETDLLIGGVGLAKGTAILGRARTTPIDRVPPLRSEVLMSLTNAAPTQLAQSYQRLNFFAGKLRDDRDWAPILLSPELVNTEFGGLLNVTDQLLKGFSLNGIVKYENFPYAIPAHWASSKPLIEELGGDVLTFNWNTSGAMAEVERQGVRALVNPRTGALPIAYIPEGLGDGSVDVSRFEERNQGFFANLNDPNLVRVVGYTTFYHLAKEFDLHAGPSCSPPLTQEARYRRSDAESYLEDLLSKLIEGQPAPGLIADPDARATEFADYLREQASAIQSDVGPTGTAEFIHYLGGVSGLATVPQPHKRVLTFAQEVSKDTFVSSSLGTFAKLIDRDVVLKEYLGHIHRPAEGYIVTPSVVISSAAPRVVKKLRDGKVEEVTVKMTGGHNLRLVPGVLRVEAGRVAASVRSDRPFEFDATVSERYLWMDPKVLQRVQKAVQDGRMTPTAAQTVLDAAAQVQVKAPRLPPPHFTDPGVGFDMPRPDSASKANPDYLVSFSSDGPMMYRARSAGGHVLEAGTTRGMLDGLAASMRRVEDGALGGAFLELQGFSDLRAKNFVRELTQRTSIDGRSRRVIFVAEHPGMIDTFRSWLRRFSGSDSASITELSSLNEANQLRTFRVSIPEVKGGLLFRIHARLTEVASSRLASKLLAIFRRPGQPSLAAQLDAFCDQEQLAVDVSISNFGPPPDVQSELVPRPSHPRSPRALASGALPEAPLVNGTL